MHNEVDNITQEIRLQYKRNYISTGSTSPTQSKLIRLTTIVSSFLTRFFIVNSDEQENTQHHSAELIGSTSDNSCYF